jgi:hypothetical protein
MELRVGSNPWYALVLFGVTTLIACSRELAPLTALVGTWNVECAIAEIRQGRKQRLQFREGDIQVSQRKKAVYIPLSACPGGRDSMLVLHHDRDNVYRLLHVGSVSELNDVLDIPSTGAGAALRYSEVEGFVAKDDTRTITLRDKGNGTYEMHFSKVRRSGEIVVATMDMRFVGK